MEGVSEGTDNGSEGKTMDPDELDKFFDVCTEQAQERNIEAQSSRCKVSDDLDDFFDCLDEFESDSKSSFHPQTESKPPTPTKSSLTSRKKKCIKN